MRLSFLLTSTLLVLNLFVLDRGREPTPVDSAWLAEHAAILPPIRAGGLALYPIVAREPITDDTPILDLDEAMWTRVLRVTEVEPARVDSLYFANAADQPVFVLAGEVLVGGKQDRVIATTTVIPPHSSQVVPVRCVEQGRWSGTTTEFTTAARLAHDRLRGNAAYAEQGDVWREVSRANQAHDTTNDTDTYRTLAERQSADAHALQQRILSGLARLPIAERRRMIGYAVAYHGEIAGIDRFGTPTLFAKLEPKLLHAYIAEALELPERDIPPPSIAAVHEIMANAKRGTVERAFSTADAQTTIQRGTIATTSQVDAGDRHLYSNYLGNNRITRTPQPQPADERTWNCDRHLYPSYLGNTRSADPCPERRPAPNQRLRRTE